MDGNYLVVVVFCLAEYVFADFYFEVCFCSPEGIAFFANILHEFIIGLSIAQYSLAVLGFGRFHVIAYCMLGLVFIFWNLQMGLN